MTNKDSKTEKKDEEDIEFNRFMEILEAADDPVIIILRVHLYAEYLLERIISAFLVRGDKVLDEGRFSFNHKTVLVDSFDVLDNELITSLKKLNKVRNGLAHELDRCISFSDVEAIGRPLGKHFTDTARKHKNKTIPTLKLTLTMLCGGLANCVNDLETNDLEK